MEMGKPIGRGMPSTEMELVCSSDRFSHLSGSCREDADWRGELEMGLVVFI